MPDGVQPGHHINTMLIFHQLLAATPKVQLFPMRQQMGFGKALLKITQLIQMQEGLAGLMPWEGDYSMCAISRHLEYIHLPLELNLYWLRVLAAAAGLAGQHLLAQEVTPEQAAVAPGAISKRL